MASPEDQGTTFVELFFDLAFVFAITRVTHYAAHHLDGHGLVRSLIVFWLIWWGWTQFTWALNAANTQHHHVRLGTLIAVGVAFVMAVSVENAFVPPAEGESKSLHAIPTLDAVADLIAQDLGRHGEGVLVHGREQLVGVVGRKEEGAILLPLTIR